MKTLYLVLGLMLVPCLVTSLAASAYSGPQISKTVPSNGRIINILYGPVGFETGDFSEVEIGHINGHMEVVSNVTHSGNYVAMIWMTPERPDNPDEPKRIGRVHWKPWSLYGTGRSADGGSAWIRRISSRAYFLIEEWEPYGTWMGVLQFDCHFWDETEGRWVYTYVGWLTIRGGSITLDHTWKAGAITREEGMSQGPAMEVVYNFELNQWYCIEFEADITENGYYRAYIDGELVVDTGVYGDLTGCGEIDRCWAGMLYSALTAEYNTIYVDDWIVADGYIGP